jgi:hypothetical protein
VDQLLHGDALQGGSIPFDETDHLANGGGKGASEVHRFETEGEVKILGKFRVNVSREHANLALDDLAVLLGDAGKHVGVHVADPFY